MSLCLARVRATFILRWSSNNWPTCMEGREGEGRGGERRSEVECGGGEGREGSEGESDWETE